MISVRGRTFGFLAAFPAMTPLEKALKDAGQSDAALAKFLDVPRQYVGRWKKGKGEKGGADFPREHAEAAARFLGVTAAFLLGVERKPLVSSFDPDEPDHLGSGGIDGGDLQPGIVHDGPSTVLVPKGGVAEVDLDAGLGGGGIAAETFVRTPDGNMFRADAVRGVWQLPDHVFSQMRSRSQNVRCFAVQGDSMLETLDEGDFVFVDVSHRVPSPPGLYALDDGFGGVIVKRLEVISGDGPEATVRIMSDNARYAEKQERAEDLRIVGRYVAMFTMRNRR